MKIICVVGARPNFMKAAPVIDALKKFDWMQVMLVHTGQHYDKQMSKQFFEDLGMPKPDMDLQVGSGSHGEQTGQIMIRFEAVLKQERPDLVMVFGDVNSTIAAALCAAKMEIAVAHVEAGLRSFDRSMPEELNRILTDHLSDLLFVTEPSGWENLRQEGIPDEKIFFVGNCMVDTLVKHREAARWCGYGKTIGVSPNGYGLLTLHRPANVDDPEKLAGMLEAVVQISDRLPIVFPCHPRTRQQLDKPEFRRLLGLDRNPGFRVTEPLGYLEFLSLMSEARLVLTDSGGIQEETTVLGIPCVTLRDNTERPVTVTQGTNTLAGTGRAGIVAATEKILRGDAPVGCVPDLWDGHAAERIAAIVEAQMGSAAGIEPAVQVKGANAA